MIRQRVLLPLAILIGLAASAAAQVTVSLQLPKRNFLAGEPVPVTVEMTNMAGRELIFQGTPNEPWIDFMVTSSRGVPMTPTGRATLGAVKIPSGQSAVRTIDISRMYAFSELGNYSVYAIVRLPRQERGGFQSNRHLFTVSSARPYWSQAVGVPGKAGQNHEFRLIQFSAERKTQLYAQVAELNSGRPLRTHHLGEVLMFRKPSVVVDGALNMHVLYLITPAIWGHARIGPDGSFIGRDLYKSSDFGDPGLVKLPDGSVRADGGIPYDPQKIAEERRNSRKASDRPAFIYE